MRTVLNLSKHDSVGRRFNNLDARPGFLEHGWDARFACWTPRTQPEAYVQQAGASLTRNVTPWLGSLGRATGNVNGYYRNSGAITGLAFYRQADLLHFHIVHEEYLSVGDWLRIGSGKPLVWTWHDPYMLSGHCIYSLGCNGFESGCVRCPNLHYHFPIRRDRSARNLQEKVDAVRRLDPLVVVASEYMRDLVERSLYGPHVRLKVVPFGVELGEDFGQQAARAALGIPAENIVVGFRAAYSEYKGLDLVQAALKRLASRYPTLPVTVIAFQEKGCCRSFSNFHLVETGWVQDADIYRYYCAMDYFLMPSKAEAFGLMAVEAMVAGATPIVTSGTALPSLVGAPVHGLTSAHTPEAFADAVETAVFNRAHNKQGRTARQQFARETYNMQSYCRELSQIYDHEIDYFHRHGRAT